MSSSKSNSNSHLKDIAQNLDHILRQPFSEDDTILQCGRETLTRLQSEPDAVLELAHSKLYEVPFKDVAERWRKLYCEASLWTALRSMQDALKSTEKTISDEELVDTIGRSIGIIDKGLVISSAPGRYGLVQKVIEQLSDLLSDTTKQVRSDKDDGELPNKRRKIDTTSRMATSFDTSKQSDQPPLKSPILNREECSLVEFQAHLLTSHKSNALRGSLPLIIRGGANHWPAIADKTWSSPSYLLSRMAMGHRLVPIELGSSYTDDDWDQKLMPFEQFLDQYMLQNPIEKGYLAQHDLFFQVPKLREDIAIPDYCYSDPPHVEGEAIPELSDDADPSLNIWMGSAHTVSTAHTDPHHNILVQVVGQKYVRLFAPSETSRLYPFGEVNGISMSNTSRVDVGEAMRLFEGWEEWEKLKPKPEVMQRDPIELYDDIESLQEDFLVDFPDFPKVKYVEGIIGPGDCLYIPKGWFHYVRSLSPSISVSFWWD